MTSKLFSVREFRDALSRFATGVTIVTAVNGKRTHGMTANSFVSVSLDPPLVLVSLDNRSKIHRVLSSAGWYGISVLAEDQRALSEHFAGRSVGEPRFVTRAGTPLVEGAIAFFVAHVIDVHRAGDHTLYIGAVEHCEARNDRPLLFYAGRYEQLGADG